MTNSPKRSRDIFTCEWLLGVSVAMGVFFFLKPRFSPFGPSWNFYLERPKVTLIWFACLSVVLVIAILRRIAPWKAHVWFWISFLIPLIAPRLIYVRYPRNWVGYLCLSLALFVLLSVGPSRNSGTGSTPPVR